MVEEDNSVEEKKEITHVRLTDSNQRVHISHLWRYISAYEYTRGRLVVVLLPRLEEALVEAKESLKTQIVHDDGECCLHIYPNGSVALMLPWKRYDLLRGA